MFELIEYVINSIERVLPRQLDLFNTLGFLKLLQNNKGQKNLGYPRKSSPFIRKKTAFFSGTPNFFGLSYFEVALAFKF